MAVGLNKVQLIGNLGEEVKLHYFDKKSCVARFSLATTETFSAKSDGTKTQHTEWHKIVVKNKLAETCDRYLSKGDLVYIEGKLRNKTWDSHGSIKNQIEISVDSIKFLKTKINLDKSNDSN